ncbi:MAG: NAD(P)/FAD-dependent oxidoreductase [Ruminococcaceae bacterium]|nr:NAD(P)/FAD-dependent oxidoreductase [Oscillospiraceae bacterium]MBQ6873313.1 NAD(P)/FAD-dependent oxidoreductase [Clostridia bacterium]
MSNKVIIIGAGAAGLMASVSAARAGADVTIIERNERPARKVMITGKGRCNVTNNCSLINDLIANVPTNGRFLYSAFTRFMPIDTMEFFENEGVELKVERGNRVFPVSDKAVDIVDALNNASQRSGAKRIQGRVTHIITSEGRVCAVKTEDGRELECDKVIVATGGKSYSVTGSTGDGYILAESLGHTIVEPKPSLVPLVAHEGWCSDAQGLSLRNVEITVYDKESYKEVYSEFGEMLFTHYGVSGPLILSASTHMHDLGKKQYEIYIDLKPALSFEQLDQRVQKDFLEFANKNLINSLGKLLPQKLIPVIVKLSGIKPTTKTNQVTKEQRHTLVNLLKSLKVTAIAFRPIDEAIVTSGGIKTSEINPKTMESKLINGLYFAGEVIDVDAYTGGFNLQIAFSTGHLAGESAAE